MSDEGDRFKEHLISFRLEKGGSLGPETELDLLEMNGHKIRIFLNEFWTAGQRKGSSIHEVSYRACFKPQLPGFFIRGLSRPGDIVLDPFSGRGTTVIEAGLLGRNFISNDINPLSRILSEPRFFPPEHEEVEKRLEEVDLGDANGEDSNTDLSMFYHPKTLGEILRLRKYLNDRKRNGKEDHLDRWIRMVATNRLTGHSSGFFSVYSLPPNQAVTPERQRMINKKLEQTPAYRDVKALILKKTKSLLRRLTPGDRENLNRAGRDGRFMDLPADRLESVGDGEVALTVTSPPFLNIVQYSSDNWLRCWFNDIDISEVEKHLTMAGTVNSWVERMRPVFTELYRVTEKGGYVAFEVGEVRNGRIRLDELVIPMGLDAGFDCNGIVINSQTFTKTSNIWGISNNTRGTNTNRIVVLEK